MAKKDVLQVLAGWFCLITLGGLFSAGMVALSTIKHGCNGCDGVSLGPGQTALCTPDDTGNAVFIRADPSPAGLAAYHYLTLPNFAVDTLPHSLRETAVNVSARRYLAHPFALLETSLASFNVTSSTRVSFYVLDDHDFASWKASSPGTTIYGLWGERRETHFSDTLTLRTSDTFWFVLDNRDGTYTAETHWAIDLEMAQYEVDQELLLGSCTTAESWADGLCEIEGIKKGDSYVVVTANLSVVNTTLNVLNGNSGKKTSSAVLGVSLAFGIVLSCLLFAIIAIGCGGSCSSSSSSSSSSSRHRVSTSSPSYRSSSSTRSASSSSHVSMDHVISRPMPASPTTTRSASPTITRAPSPARQATSVEKPKPRSHSPTPVAREDEIVSSTQPSSRPRSSSNTPRQAQRSAAIDTDHSSEEEEEEEEKARTTAPVRRPARHTRPPSRYRSSSNDPAGGRASSPTAARDPHSDSELSSESDDDGWEEFKRRRRQERRFRRQQRAASPTFAGGAYPPRQASGGGDFVLPPHISPSYVPHQAANPPPFAPPPPQAPPPSFASAPPMPPPEYIP